MVESLNLCSAKLSHRAETKVMIFHMTHPPNHPTTHPKIQFNHLKVFSNYKLRNTIIMKYCKIHKWLEKNFAPESSDV